MAVCGSTQEVLDNASFGLQRHLVLTTWPSTVANTAKLDTAVYPRLVDQTAGLANGTYYCRVCIGGVSSVKLQMKATFSGGTVDVSAVSCYLPKVGNESDATMFATPFAYQAFTGTAALASTVLTAYSLAASLGEQIAIVKIVVAGGALPVFTQAEVNGR